MNATPEISSTRASASDFLLTKLAVMAIANRPRNSFLLKPGANEYKKKKCVWRQTDRDVTANISFDTIQCVSLAVGADQNVEFVLRDWMIGRAYFSLPSDF